MPIYKQKSRNHSFINAYDFCSLLKLMTLYKIVGLRTGGRRAKCLKNRVKSSKIELRFREVRSQSSS